MPKQSNAHASLVERQRDIVARWRERVFERLGPDDLSRAELTNAMPAFVEELIAALDPSEDAPSPLPDDSATASRHGRQRLRLGFDVDEVVREYGILGETILEALRADGVALTSRDARVIFVGLNTGAAEAIGEYVQRRDAEARKQAAQHLGFIAHELRNPLGAAWTALAILRQVLTEPPGRALQFLERSLAQLRQLVDQVLIAGRLEADVDPEYQPVRLDDLMRDVELDSAAEAESRRVTLAVDVAENLACEADRRLLFSALTNLVRNAVKFSAPGGTVTVRIRADHGQIVVEVQDACGGLPPDAGTTLFEPFVQRGTDRTGLGLGLAIVKQAIEAHRGQVAVRDLPGNGCVFTARFPIAPPPAA